MTLPQNRRGAVSRRELVAIERRVLGKRHALWLGLAAVLLPLAVLLTLQYRWLTELETSSTAARRATLQKRLQVVSKEASYFYYKIAERSLNLPASMLAPDTIQKAAYHFKKKEIVGARELFVVSYLTPDEIWFYDPGGLRMVNPPFSDEYLAVWSATAPWNILHKKGVALETVELDVHQRDPAHRIILNPITDEKSRVVGLAGMILDQDYFVDVLLPKVIAEALPEAVASDDLVVCVRDGSGRQVLPWTGRVDPDDDHVRAWFGFVFTDWSIALQGDLASPERWARTNFYLNLSLTAVLAVVLVSGILLTLRTALREMRLSAMKNEFVSNVSHELRTPLSSIRVFGEFLRHGRVDDPAKIREYGTYIETESRRLTQLINNILDFSRIESGRRVYRLEPTDVERILEQALASFGVRLRASGFELAYRGPATTLPPVRADAHALEQAVANLLDNAVKYSGEARRIEVELARADGMIEIAVTDHGIGIPRSEQERIFERFHRVSTGLVHDVKGSGLGLALVRHIMAAHGGHVSVRSEPGKGSTFTLHVPCERGDAA